MQRIYPACNDEDVGQLVSYCNYNVKDTLRLLDSKKHHFQAYFESNPLPIPSHP